MIGCNPSGLHAGLHLHPGGAEQRLVMIGCNPSGLQIGFSFHRLSPFVGEYRNSHAKQRQ